MTKATLAVVSGQSTGVEWEFQEENLAGAYLTQALTAIIECADAAALYPKRSAKQLSAQTSRDKIVDKMIASGKGLELARTSILFSALAAEAYINAFLWREGKRVGLSKKDLDAIDRLPTAEKFVLGPRLITGEAVFGRGREPIQRIRALFKLRDLLVHPKVRRVRVRKNQLFDRPGFEDYNPEAAAQFVVVVSKAVTALAEATDPPGPTDSTAQGVLSVSDRLVGIGHDAREKLPSRPRRKVRRAPAAPSRLLGIPTTETGPPPRTDLD